MSTPKKDKKPWPTKEAMQQIYECNLWGGKDIRFYSGEGSHDLTFVTPYIEAISSFLRSFDNSLIVCDLGCGDFNIGRQLVEHTQKYIAIDIVPELIAYNKTIFIDDRLTFECLDIAKDKLPTADCILLRQVLQHLSNKEIKEITQKLTGYQYVILTEHLPIGDFMPNIDIISGQGIRLKKESGIDLLASPFNLKIARQKELISIDLPNAKGKIVTTVYTVF